MNLVEAIEPQAALIAHAVVTRVPGGQDGPWAGYHADEGLFGQLMMDFKTGDYEVEFQRKVNPNATMRCAFIEMLDMSDSYVSPPHVVREEVIDRVPYTFDFKTPDEGGEFEYDRELVHTFTKAKSYSEARKEAWEVALKANFGFKAGPITGSVEATAKYGQTIDRNTSETETTTDTIREKIHVKAPFKAEYEAVRSNREMSQLIKAKARLNYKFYLHNGDLSNWEASVEDAFIPMIKGELPVNVEYTNMEKYFRANPLTDEEIAAIADPETKEIEQPFSWFDRNSMRFTVK